MIALHDVLTWEGIRDLSTCRALRDTHGRIRWTRGESQRRVLLARPRGVWAEPHQRRGPKAGEIVGTRDAWWAPWRQRLIRQPQPFVLVTNFHDSLITDAAVADLRAEGSAVRAWFGVQVNTTDPRVTAMPVGAERETVQRMAGIERRAPCERDVLLYLNFKRRNREREALWAQYAWATREPWAVDGTARYVAQLGRARFVLSPPGRGWDCYRTYEALAMGAIPIVRRQRPLSDVVEGMPVLLVDDWAEVTPERLAYEYPRIAGSLTRLTLAYWREQITQAVEALKGVGTWHE